MIYDFVCRSQEISNHHHQDALQLLSHRDLMEAVFVPKNDKRAAWNHRVTDARGGLLSTKEAQELHEVIAECNFSFLSA